MTPAFGRCYQRGEGEWSIVALIFACALTFCGTPDLHDVLIDRLKCAPAASTAK